MQRIPRHRLLAAVLTFLSLMAIAMLPIGGFVSAASAATNCPNSEGTFCILAISAPESVATGRVFTVYGRRHDRRHHRGEERSLREGRREPSCLRPARGFRSLCRQNVGRDRHLQCGRHESRLPQSRRDSDEARLLLRPRFRYLRGGRHRSGSAHRPLSGQRVVRPDDERYRLGGDVVRGHGIVHRFLQRPRWARMR